MFEGFHLLLNGPNRGPLRPFARELLRPCGPRRVQRGRRRSTWSTLGHDTGAPRRSGWARRHRAFGGHEVAQVVKSEVAKPGSAAHPDEALGHKVRRPRTDACVVGPENEEIVESHHFPIRYRSDVLLSKKFKARCVKGNPMERPVLVGPGVGRLVLPRGIAEY